MLQTVLCVVLFFCSFVALAEDTVLKLYRPYGDTTDQASPVIKSTLSGQCHAQSQLIVREDAWRCEAGDKVYDPCFVKAGANRTQAVCPQSPWVSDSVAIVVKTPLDNEQNTTLDMSRTFPWAIELTNGERCQAVASSEVYDEMPVHYRCANHNVLIGYLQRCKSVWSMLERKPEGVVTAELVRAWF